MRKGLCLVLCLMLVLALCACAGENTDSTPTVPPTSEVPPTTEDATVPTTTEASEETETVPEETETVPEETETTPEETEPTAPEHSALYHPDYTYQQVMEYFEEVVLHTEYTDGGGDDALVQKWNEPIVYEIWGEPTEEDRTVLATFFAQLNEVPGFPGIREAEKDEFANLTLSFLNREDFNISFQDFLNGEEAFGATRYWYYTDTNEIYTANIGYRTDVDQSARNSILIEEIINTMAITDTVLRTDSIVYQYSDENTALSDMDWIILKLLYDPAIRCGMNYEECCAVIQELYY